MIVFYKVAQLLNIINAVGGWLQAGQLTNLPIDGSPSLFH